MNIATVSDIQEALSPMGIIVYEAKRVSQHPDDAHLFYILAKKGEEYVTWLYNHDQKGCNHGNYFMSYRNAAKDFANRN